MEPKGRNDDHVFDYSKITDQLYIGSDLCKRGVCLIHGEEFKALGVEFEINMSRENNELPPKDMKIGYLWLPVADGYSPTQLQLDIGTSAMNDIINQEKNVYVHCKNGHGRSPTMVIAYFVRYQGYFPDDAATFIKEIRPEIHIEDTQKKELYNFKKRWS